MPHSIAGPASFRQLSEIRQEPIRLMNASPTLPCVCLFLISGLSWELLWCGVEAVGPQIVLSMPPVPPPTMVYLWGPRLVPPYVTLRHHVILPVSAVVRTHTHTPSIQSWALSLLESCERGGRNEGCRRLVSHLWPKSLEDIVTHYLHHLFPQGFVLGNFVRFLSRRQL